MLNTTLTPFNTESWEANLKKDLLLHKNPTNQIMINRRLVIISIIAIIGIVLFSCCSDSKIPLDKIDVNINVNRLDRALFKLKPENIEENILELEREYGEFFRLFTEEIIGIGTTKNPDFSDYLLSFTTDNMVSETYREVQKVFPNTGWLNMELTNAFKRYRYYFPNLYIPKVYGFISGFNNSVLIADSVLAVSFDRYLGRNCEYYTNLGIPKYLQYNMHPRKIPSDLVRAWAFSEFVFNDSIDNLINNVIYEGSLMYLTKKLLPQQSDSLIFGFTPEQMKWCRGNESHMWAYLVEHKLLFSTDNFTINQFVSGAPFTQGFPPESPGKAAVWLGYRIVSRFMDKNKEYTLEMLMNEKDYQSILSRARYNP